VAILTNGKTHFLPNYMISIFQQTEPQMESGGGCDRKQIFFTSYV